MEESKYHLLEDDNSSIDDECYRLPKSGQKQTFKGFLASANDRKPPITCTATAILGLLASIAINLLCFLEIKRLHLNPPLGPTCRSSYAELVNDLEIPWHWDSERNNPDDEARNKLWYEDEEGDKGIIAMPNEEARGYPGLPESQPFPWDPKEKSIYITNGHHNLHCIRNIYIAIDQYSKGVPQTIDRTHILHCLGALYDDVKCNADDTPRYTVKHGLRPGENQIRKCRDWTKLQKYVADREGCFKNIFHNVHNISQIERVKYCSNDSPYLAKIRKYFGYEENWTPWPYVQQDDYLTTDQAP